MELTPGDVITADFPAGAHDVHTKARPAVVMCLVAPFALVAPITDAARGRFPADAELRDFPSGTQTKHARVSCDRVRSFPIAALQPRADARPLTRVERSRVVLALRIAWGLFPTSVPTRSVRIRRSTWVREDGGRRMLVLSPDDANQHDHTCVVVPSLEAPGVVPVAPPVGVDLGHLTTVRAPPLTPLPEPPLAADAQAMLDTALRGLLDGLRAE